MLPRATSGVIYQPVARGAVLLHVEQEVYFGLNSVGARVWAMLPPVCESLEQLCAAVHKEFPDVGEDVIRSDVAELLGHLADLGLVVTSNPGVSDGAHVARTDP